MQTTIPTKLVQTKVLPFFTWSFLFGPSLGVGKLKTLTTLQRKRYSGGLIVKKMSGSLEKCDGSGMEIGGLGVSRPATEDYAEEAIKALKAGKVIVVPTDTLYGFACDALWFV